MNRLLVAVLAVFACLFSSSAACASSSGELLSFEGLKDLQPVGDFYNGAGRLTTTPNYGITSSSNFLDLRSPKAAMARSPRSHRGIPAIYAIPAIFVNSPTGADVTGSMNVNGGFAGGLQFFYSASFSQTVTIWSSANGTGTVLAVLAPVLNNNGNCTFPTYCNWSSVGLAFSGRAKSLTFTGAADGMGIADINVASGAAPIPEPSTLCLLGCGLVGVSMIRLRRIAR